MNEDVSNRKATWWESCLIRGARQVEDNGCECWKCRETRSLGSLKLMDNNLDSPCWRTEDFSRFLKGCVCLPGLPSNALKAVALSKNQAWGVSTIGGGHFDVSRP